MLVDHFISRIGEFSRAREEILGRDIMGFRHELSIDGHRDASFPMLGSVISKMELVVKLFLGGSATRHGNLINDEEPRRTNCALWEKVLTQNGV